MALHKTFDKKDYSLSDKVSKPESQVHEEISDLLDGILPHALLNLPKHERDTLLSMLRGKGYSVHQIERTTGISRGIIARCKPE